MYLTIRLTAMYFVYMKLFVRDVCVRDADCPKGIAVRLTFCTYTVPPR